MEYQQIDWVNVKTEYSKAQKNEILSLIFLVFLVVFSVATAIGAVARDSNLFVTLSAGSGAIACLCAFLFSFKKYQACRFYVKRSGIIPINSNMEIVPEKYNQLVESAQALCDGGETWMQEEICQLMKDNGLITRFEAVYLFWKADDHLENLKQNKARIKTILFCQTGESAAQ